MTLEHYSGFAEREIERHVSEAKARWPIQAVRVVHRVGTLTPGERIVFVGVASAHRQASFEAAMFLMDYLKTRAPFWKREDRPSGAVWVGSQDARRHNSRTVGGNNPGIALRSARAVKTSMPSYLQDPPSWLWILATVIAAAAQTVRNTTQRGLTKTLGTTGATNVRFLFGFPFR